MFQLACLISMVGICGGCNAVLPRSCTEHCVAARLTPYVVGIAVVVTAIGDAGYNEEWASQSIKHTIAYCNRHHYTLYVFRTLINVTYHADNQPQWNKLLHIGAALARHTWVLYKDLDAFFMQPDKQLEDFIRMAPRAHFIIAADTMIMNDGVFFVRATTYSRQFLQNVFDTQISHGVSDNAAFQALIGGCKPTDSQMELMKCYRAMDVGFTDAGIERQLKAGHISSLQQQLQLSNEILKNFFWLPHARFAALRAHYTADSFILHWAGQTNKADILEFIKASDQLHVAD